MGVVCADEEEWSGGLAQDSEDSIQVSILLLGGLYTDPNTDAGQGGGRGLRTASTPQG